MSDWGIQILNMNLTIFTHHLLVIWGGGIIHGTIDPFIGYVFTKKNIYFDTKLGLSANLTDGFTGWEEKASNVDGKLTWSNTFRIAIDKNTTISIKGKKQISNGYYVARTSYTLNPTSAEGFADIEIEYKGNGKFGNSINVKGMSIVLE
jgi:hypothetical protein